MELDFDSWCEKSGGWKRFYIWKIPGARLLFDLWYRLGGFYVQGWTPVVYQRKG